MFANLWYLPIAAKMCNVMAFAPVDETHSRLYLRTYMGPFAVPGFATLAASLSSLFSRVVLGQDLRVVETQPPGPTAEIRDEKLVQSDLAIARFRQEVLRRSKAKQRRGPELVELRLPTGT